MGQQVINGNQNEFRDEVYTYIVHCIASLLMNMKLNPFERRT